MQSSACAVGRVWVEKKNCLVFGLIAFGVFLPFESGCGHVHVHSVESGLKKKRFWWKSFSFGLFMSVHVHM